MCRTDSAATAPWADPSAETPGSTPARLTAGFSFNSDERAVSPSPAPAGRGSGFGSHVHRAARLRSNGLRPPCGPSVSEPRASPPPFAVSPARRNKRHAHALGRGEAGRPRPKSPMNASSTSNSACAVVESSHGRLEAAAARGKFNAGRSDEVDIGSATPIVAQALGAYRIAIWMEVPAKRAQF